MAGKSENLPETFCLRLYKRPLHLRSSQPHISLPERTIQEKNWQKWEWLNEKKNDQRFTILTSCEAARQGNKEAEKEGKELTGSANSHNPGWSCEMLMAKLLQPHRGRVSEEPCALWSVCCSPSSHGSFCSALRQMCCLIANPRDMGWLLAVGIAFSALYIWKEWADA